jgi:hypothetical protein
LALDLAGGQFDANTLEVRLKHALGLLYELETDTAAFLALAFVNDAAARDGAVAGDDANAGHIGMCCGWCFVGKRGRKMNSCAHFASCFLITGSG